MNVASKIIVVASLAFLPILGVHTWMSLEREETLFRSDMERDLSVLAAYLRGVAETEWHRDGAAGVRAVLAAEPRSDQRVALEWKTESLEAPGLAERKDALAWVEPVVVEGTTIGEIVLTESLAPMRDYLTYTLVRLVVLTVVLIAAGLLVARLLSHRLIAGRLDRLAAFAAATGAGRLGEPIDVGGNDEITALGASLETMGKMLVRARHETERVNRERMTMLQHLRHADRLASLGRLAGSVAHELGTPLNVVMGHANRIAEGAQTADERKESAATIHRQAKRMEQTIRDILGYVRQTPGEEQQIELEGIVESVLELLRPLAQHRRVQLEAAGTLASAGIRGRVVQLEQALSNLVSNAIDASPEGGRVTISLGREERRSKVGGREESMIVVRVQDQGPGVAQEDVARLFDAFFTSKPAGQGTGLGLWLAEGIARDHDGFIEVSNRAEGGACFAIVLPESRVG